MMVVPGLKNGQGVGVGGHVHLPYAATEECLWRRRLLVGEVHDENAHALGGISGHAGLFGTATDVLRFGQEVLRALLGKSSVFSQEVVKRFLGDNISAQTSSSIAKLALGGMAGEPDTWALGWDRPSIDGTSSAGKKVSPWARGHLGFTGTSIWIDPEKEAVAVLLTNRVHYGRMDVRLKKFRPLIHDMFWDRC